MRAGSRRITEDASTSLHSLSPALFLLRHFHAATLISPVQHGAQCVLCFAAAVPALRMPRTHKRYVDAASALSSCAPRYDDYEQAMEALNITPDEVSRVRLRCPRRAADMLLLRLSQDVARRPDDGVAAAPFDPAALKQAPIFAPRSPRDAPILLARRRKVAHRAAAKKVYAWRLISRERHHV